MKSGSEMDFAASGPPPVIITIIIIIIIIIFFFFFFFFWPVGPPQRGGPRGAQGVSPRTHTSHPAIQPATTRSGPSELAGLAPCWWGPLEPTRTAGLGGHIPPGEVGKP